LQGWILTDFRCMVAIVIAYLGFVVAGPGIMESVSASTLNLYMARFVYNVVQIIICSYTLLHSCGLLRTYGYSMTSCNSSVEHKTMANLHWIWYMTKILDLGDTVFMVLERRSKQLKFVHVFHHAGSVLFTWIKANSSFDTDALGTAILISIEHILIYLYFFASMHSKNPKTGQSIPIWWKPHLIFVKLLLHIFFIANTAVMIGCPRQSLNVALIVFMCIQVHFLLAEMLPCGATSKTKGS